jgi:hypothetical protein
MPRRSSKVARRAKPLVALKEKPKAPEKTRAEKIISFESTITKEEAARRSKLTNREKHAEAEAAKARRDEVQAESW